MESDPRFRDGSNSFAQPYEEIVQLKSRVADGKNYRTDVIIPNTKAAKAGRGIAKQARKRIERQTGKSVVSRQNYLASGAAKGVLKASPRKP